MRRLLVAISAALAVAALVAGLALGVGKEGEVNNKNFEYAIGLWGDVPYSDIQATVGVPNLIADMNRQTLEFTVNDGDLKAGSGPCTDDVYTRALTYFASLDAPAMFTPGDNDWTDCDRVAGVNSLERLDFERRLFFSTPYSFGKHPVEQDVQSEPACLGVAGPTPCVENRRWTTKKVTYATVNVQGSCNNLCDTAPNAAEWAARNAANIAWLEDTFAEAKAEGSAGVMIVGQADLGFDGSDATRAPLRNPRTLAQTDGQPDGFQAFMLAFRDLTVAYGKPVVYVHGDSHYFRVDKPLQDSLGRRVENFTRVETFGDHQENGLNDVHWLKVLVNPQSREVFAFQPQIVPGNRVAVPAP